MWVTQEKIKLAVQEGFQRIFKDGHFPCWKEFDRIHGKMGDGFLEKIIAYPNEVIHYDSIVAFTGGYEKIVSEKQSQS